MTEQRRLLHVFQTLMAAYGPQHWWPAESPWEVIVGAILTQSAAWRNVEKAIANLKGAGLLDAASIHYASQERLAQLVYPSGYYNAKARKLKAFAQRLQEAHGGDLQRLLALDVPNLRRELLSIHGVGPETADSIMLYAAEKPVFVIDAYTTRIAVRLGLAAPKPPYEDLQALFMSSLPHDAGLFNEYHALLVHLGKGACRKQPLCPDCPLQAECPKCDT